MLLLPHLYELCGFVGVCVCASVRSTERMRVCARVCVVFFLINSAVTPPGWIFCHFWVALEWRFVRVRSWSNNESAQNYQMLCQLKAIHYLREVNALWSLERLAWHRHKMHRKAASLRRPWAYPGDSIVYLVWLSLRILPYFAVKKYWPWPVTFPSGLSNGSIETEQRSCVSGKRHLYFSLNILEWT